MLQVSRSGFYDWRKREPADWERQVLQDLVRDIHEGKRGRIGSRRMAKELQRRGYQIGRLQARSLMREAGVECRQRRRFKATTDSNHGRPVAPNLLERQFNVVEPDRIWVADITTIWTREGWEYLAAILDLADRQVVGWAMADHMRTGLATSALDMALGRRQPEAGLIHHSDRGSQYAANEFQQMLADKGVRQSMSRKGDCWDNAVMERFFGTLKSEWTDARQYATREEARRDVIHFIEMEYNSQRPHTTLGYQSPREREWELADVS